MDVNQLLVFYHLVQFSQSPEIRDSDTLISLSHVVGLTIVVISNRDISDDITSGYCERLKEYARHHNFLDFIMLEAIPSDTSKITLTSLTGSGAAKGHMYIKSEVGGTKIYKRVESGMQEATIHYV